MTVIVLAIYVLAVMRLTRLINFDRVLDWFRTAVVKVFGTHSEVVVFLGCPWCVGMWLSLAGAPAATASLGWPLWSAIPVGLACSQIIGMAAPLYADDDEIEYVEVAR